MCALTPLFPSVQQQQESYSASTMEYPWISRVDSFSPSLHLPSFLYPNPLAQSDCFKNYNINMSLSHCNGTYSNSNNDQEEDRVMVLEKKFNHNASERDRRRKLNALYSSLRDLLPASDQKRKLSIPMTVARVVKYIPEQKQELQRFSRRKEELLRKTHQEEIRSKPMVDSIHFSSQKIAANWLTDTEIAIQIATSKWTSISDMLLKLEANRLIVISVSSSVSSTGRILYTLHLQMSGDCRVRLEELSDMLFGLS